MDLISDGIYNLIIFVLAIYVGYHVVWNVTPALAVALAAVNVFGGFLVTRRMLEMFKKKDRSAAKAEGQ